MKYIVTFNIPNQPTVQVSVDENKMQPLMEAINQKKVVEIDGGFYNTAYFAVALPDKTSIQLDSEKRLMLEETRKKYSAKH